MSVALATAAYAGAQALHVSGPSRGGGGGAGDRRNGGGDGDEPHDPPPCPGLLEPDRRAAETRCSSCCWAFQTAVLPLNVRDLGLCAVAIPLVLVAPP